jgi:cysteine desulfurase
MTYLDYNATAPMRPQVRQAMLSAMGQVGNPSSVHGYGRSARKLVEDARGSLAKFVGASPAEIVLTASATEANHLALQGVSFQGAQPMRLLVSAVEHASLLKQPCGVECLAVTADGVVDLLALEELLAARPDQPTLISVMLANNETGIVQPIAEVVALAKRYGALVHSDVVQGVGRMAVDFAELGVDLMTLGFHKCGGPLGVGALVVRSGVPLRPYLYGGGHEQGRRAGTHNIAAIAGMGALVDVLLDTGPAEWQQQRLLQQRLESGLSALMDVTVIGDAAPRLGNISGLTQPKLPAQQQLIQLDLAGIAVSSGSACSSGKVIDSHVLRAMNMAEPLRQNAIRVSWGWGTSPADIDHFLDGYHQLFQNAQRTGTS